MRALLIANPRATSTTQVRRDVLARALASELDLKVVETRYRGHAGHVATEAAQSGYDLVLTLGGDGTVNETVNGLLHARQDADGRPARGPALAALPGGNANVFTRALGLPTDPIDATGQILSALINGRYRSISLGMAGDRYFLCNAGLGLDAEVVRAVEGRRADGEASSAGLYVWTAVNHFYGVTDRRQPALTLEREGHPPIGRLFLGIVSNTAPWTYLGRRAVNPSPRASFGTGLDLFALRGLGTFGVLSALGRMLSQRGGAPGGPSVVSLHDECCFTLRSSRPIAFQVDGEYVGEREFVRFQSIPDALRVAV